MVESYDENVKAYFFYKVIVKFIPKDALLPDEIEVIERANKMNTKMSIEYTKKAVK